MVLQDSGFEGAGFQEGDPNQPVIVLTQPGVEVATGLRPAPRTMNPTVIAVLRAIATAAQGQVGVPVDEQEIIHTPGTGGPMLVGEALERLQGFGYIQIGALGQ